MRVLMILVVGLMFSVPVSVMAAAGSGTQLKCLQTCDFGFSESDVVLEGSQFVYKVTNSCTRCCDNTFGKKYKNCKALKKACLKLCYAKKTFTNCKEICEANKGLCEESNAVKKTFSCPSN